MRIHWLHTVDLVIDSWHFARGSSGGVLRILGTNLIIDSAALRKDPNGKIISDDPETVCRVLGIRFPDPQVIQE